jgi:hypothetical protein
VHAGGGGDPFQRGEIPIHIRMSAVDDAAHAVRSGGFRLFDHDVDIVGEARGHRPALLFGHCFGERISNRQMFVEQHRTVDAVGRHVGEQRADDGAALENRRLRLRLRQSRHQAGARCRSKNGQCIAPRHLLTHRRILRISHD